MSKHAGVAEFMAYIRERANKPDTDDFVNWVASVLEIKPTQVRKVYRWISGENEPGMTATLALLRAVDSEGVDEGRARAVLAESLEAVRGKRPKDAEKILGEALQWFDDYHAGQPEPRSAPGTP